MRQQLSPRAILGGVAWIVAGQGITVVSGLVSNAILARSLGPSGTGLIAVSLVIPAFFALAAGGGLAAANVYFTGKGRIATGSLAWNSVLVAVVGSTVSALIVGLGALSGVLWTLVPGLSPVMVVLAICILPILMLRQSTGAILLGLGQMSRASRIDMIQAACYLLALGLVVVVFGAGPVGGLFAFLAAALVALSAALIWLRESGMTIFPALEVAQLGRTLKYGYRASIGIIVQFFTYRLDLLLVNMWVGTSVAGQYSIAARIAEMMWLLPSAVGAVLFSASSAAEPEEMNRITPRAFWITMCVSILAALAIVVIGPVAIPFLFSDSFNGAYAPLVILLPGTVLLGSSSVLANDLAGRGHPGLISVVAVVTVGVTVTLDALLIPALGVNGAALASTISYSLYAGLIVIAYVRVSAVGRGFLLLKAPTQPH